MLDPDSLDGVKTLIDTWRSALGFVKDARDLIPEGENKEAASEALENAEKAAVVAEAQIAQALGYELCRCEFPPTPMLRVGYMAPWGDRKGGPVHECPKCEQDTAGPWMWERKIPKPE
jgi:hypothetical protein